MKIQKINIAGIIVLIFISVFILYYRIFLLRDYLIRTQVSCNPVEETCFIHVCDPTAEPCSENSEENILVYKIIEKKANDMPVCLDGGCPEPTCMPEEADCTVIQCSEEATAESGDTCSSS